MAEQARSQQQQAASASRKVPCPYCGQEIASRNLYAHLNAKHAPEAGKSDPTGVTQPTPPKERQQAAQAQEQEGAQDPPEGDRCPSSPDGWHDWKPLNPAIPLHAKGYALGWREYCRHCEELWKPEGGAGK